MIQLKCTGSRRHNTFKEFVTNIDDKTEKEIDLDKAVKRLLPKHKHKFESLFEYDLDLFKETDSEDGNEEDPEEVPSLIGQLWN